MSSNLSSGSDDVVIRVEHLGKRYLMPNAAGTKRAASSNGGRFARAKRHAKTYFPWLHQPSDEDYFWALRDVSFELKRGEILGVIGRNGSGKSTMLKILSAVTMPSEGRADLLGRVGSLLEVGTGFHPDLSGRDNIFMSGALLGVSRREIAQKFDEIVDYSGVERFIDMPVKRYSSGMYVRLAYAVTALLRSDILILDEVLAVGDAEFQKRTKKNVESIAHDGRTVIFVSHSMASINKICTHAIQLEQGQIVRSGEVGEVTEEYIAEVTQSAEDAAIDIAKADPFVDLTHAEGFFEVREHPIIASVETLKGDRTPATVFQTGEAMIVRIGIRANPEKLPYVDVFFLTQEDMRAMVVKSNHTNTFIDAGQDIFIECRIPELRLVNGDYTLMLDYGRYDLQPFSQDCIPEATRVRVQLGDYLGGQGLTRNQGLFAQQSQWQVNA